MPVQKRGLTGTETGDAGTQTGDAGTETGSRVQKPVLLGLSNSVCTFVARHLTLVTLLHYMYQDDQFRIRLKNLPIGTDNLLDIDPAVLAATKKPSMIRVRQGTIILDGIPLSTTNIERKLYVYKSDLDALGYTFVGDLLKLVNKGFVHRGKSNQSQNKGCAGYIQTKAPSKPLSQDDLTQFDKFLIPCDYLFSILGAGKTTK